MFHVPPPTRICGLFREEDEASLHAYLTVIPNPVLWPSPARHLQAARVSATLLWVGLRRRKENCFHLVYGLISILVSATVAFSFSSLPRNIGS